MNRKQDLELFNQFMVLLFQSNKTIAAEKLGYSFTYMDKIERAERAVSEPMKQRLKDELQLQIKEKQALLKNTRGW